MVRGSGGGEIKRRGRAGGRDRAEREGKGKKQRGWSL